MLRKLVRGLTGIVTDPVSLRFHSALVLGIESAGHVQRASLGSNFDEQSD
jgi:hypothetical protein